MASPIGSRGSFTIPGDENGSNISIHISEQAGVKAENLSLSTWGASFVLANVLHKLKLPSRTEDRHRSGHISPNHEAQSPWILELGAGTGLVGLSAAAIWKCRVVLTDLPSILPGLAANIELNDRLLAKNSAFASCGSLDWNNPTSIVPYPSKSIASLPKAPAKASIILAADTIYAEDHPELLSKTILTWLAPGPDSRAILCYPLRVAYIDHIREFWQLMEESGLECVEEGREEAMEGWGEVANTPYEYSVWAWKGEQ